MSSTIMSSLFRPWAVEQNSKAVEILPDHNKLPSFGVFAPPIHQDSTVSTTTSSLTLDHADSSQRDKPLGSPSIDRLQHSTPMSNNVNTNTTKTIEKTFRKPSKLHQDVLERRHQKRNSLKSRKTLNHTFLDVKTKEMNSSALNNVQAQSCTSHYEWAATNIGSGDSSAFHRQIPSKLSNKVDVPHPPRLPPNITENLHLLEGLPFGCASADLGYSAQYCCPDLSLDLLSSELALESALLRGVLPSPAQMEEYARLLQIQDNNLKGANRKQRPKKYRCPHCQVAFSNNGQLKGHVRIHTGERPYKCDVTACAKTFTRNEELTRHKRIHSGLRPYACATCGKRFGRKDHLKKHARTHQPHYHRQALMVPLLPPMVHPYPYLYGM